MKDSLTPEQLETITRALNRCAVKVFITMDYNDLDNLITAAFNFRGMYECVSANEWCNDQSHDFRIDGVLDKWDEQHMIEFLEKKSYHRCNAGTQTILNYLCHHGIINAGNYLIEVSW